MDTSVTVVEKGQWTPATQENLYTSQSQTALDSLQPYTAEHARSRQTALDRLHSRAQDIQQPKAAAYWPLALL